MPKDPDLPYSLMMDSHKLWLVEIEFIAQPQYPGVYKIVDSLEKACAIVSAYVRRAQWHLDVRVDQIDDDLMVPTGNITMLVWKCPTRAVTKADIEEYAKEGAPVEAWRSVLGSARISDPALAVDQGVVFPAGQPVECARITRLSRYIGYLYRSSRLNNYDQDFAQLKELYSEYAQELNQSKPDGT